MALKFPIYLDHNATCPMDERVLEAMLPYFTDQFGNASSRSHSYGWAAEDAVDKARKQAADLIGSSSKEIIWTSGSTESNNLAIKGIARMYGGEAGKGNHIITSTIEHKATLDPCKRLMSEGFDVTFLEPGPDGVIYAKDVEAAMREDTILVTIMWANNEIGTVNEIEGIGKLCKEKGVFFHTDATQWVGKMPTNVDEAGVDLMSWSGHKIYGPKGVGALYVRRRKPRVRLEAIIDGGGHERGMRSGTLNVPGIVGFGKACEIAQREMLVEGERLRKMRDRLETELAKDMDGVQVNGHKDRRLPHVTNVSFEWVEGESLLMDIKDIAVSSGSACTSASLEPSYVLKGLGVGDEMAHSSIRFGLGRRTTEEEIDYVIKHVREGVERLREMSPLYELHKEGVDYTTIEWGDH